MSNIDNFYVCIKGYLVHRCLGICYIVTYILERVLFSILQINMECNNFVVTKPSDE